MASKLKALKPSLREKKRYIVFEVISKAPVTGADASKAIWQGCLQFLGELGMSRAGMIVMQDNWQHDSQRGILRVSHSETGRIRAALTLISSVGEKDAVIRTLGISGVLGKAKTNFLRGKPSPKPKQ